MEEGISQRKDCLIFHLVVCIFLIIAHSNSSCLPLVTQLKWAPKKNVEKNGKFSAKCCVTINQNAGVSKIHKNVSFTFSCK